MSINFKKKMVLSVGIAIIGALLFFGLLLSIQTGLSVNTQQNDTKLKLQQMDALIKNADEAAEQTTKTYDEVFVSKVRSLAYMVNRAGEDNYTVQKLQEANAVIDATNLLILDREGQQIAATKETDADFTQSRYNLLRTVFDTSQPSEEFAVNRGGISYRYYGAKIDDHTMAVIEQDPSELTEMLDNTSTWKSILGNVSVGLEGFAFAVSSKDYTFLYYPQEDMIGQDSLQAGLHVEDLEDQNYMWMTIDGERLYCGVSKVDDSYIVCAVTEEEIIASRNITVGVVLFIFIAVLTIVILYAFFTMKAEIRDHHQRQEAYVPIGGLYFDKVVGRKIGMVAIIGLVAVLCMSFYMQTLFSLSRQSMSNEQHVKEVEKVIQTGKKNIETITQQYDDRYLNKCRIAAYLLSTHSDIKSREELQLISDMLGVEYINEFNANGEKIATSSMYTKFKISDNPEDQSYAFTKILKGVDFVIQNAQEDEISGEYRQFMGVALRDEQGNASGFVQIAIKPSKLENALQNTQISNVLQGVKLGTNGFAFAIDKKDKTFAYYPTERLMGRKATNYGMEKQQFHDGYSDYITINGDKYYGSSLEADNYYIYVVVPVSEMTHNRTAIAIVSAAASFLCLLLIFCILTFHKRARVEQAVRPKAVEHQEDEPMIDVVMPDGSIRKTESVNSRWANISIDWDDKTAEQRVFSLLKGIFAIFALAISFAVIFREQFIGSNSIFLYVLDGRWERGLNIFALTACFMLICVISVCSMILKKVLQILARTFGARGETLCRLLSSFVKYASVITMLYYCLLLVGVDAKTLLASAGILTLVVGLGARTLVSDILAGLFIIFEGEFRVGDIVTIGDCRGTVLEIGIRTTKIENGSKDVKVISNSAVSGVVNMTKYHSYASCDIGIHYNESLEQIESILKKELPNIKKVVPIIQQGPDYKGVVQLGEGKMTLRILAQCTETDRIQVDRALKREMKLLFDKYDIQLL